MPSPQEILASYLRSNGYSGLCAPSHCACTTGGLLSCVEEGRPLRKDCHAVTLREMEEWAKKPLPRKSADPPPILITGVPVIPAPPGVVEPRLSALEARVTALEAGNAQYNAFAEGQIERLTRMRQGPPDLFPGVVDVSPPDLVASLTDPDGPTKPKE